MTPERIQATRAGAGLWDGWLDGKQVALGCKSKKRALYWAQRALMAAIPAYECANPTALCTGCPCIKRPIEKAADCPCACHWGVDDGKPWHMQPCCDQPIGSKRMSNTERDEEGQSVPRSIPDQEECMTFDLTHDAQWNNGCDFALEQLCKYLGVDLHDVLWDAATETVEGDVTAVIVNIFAAKYGDDFDPKAAKVSRGVPQTSRGIADIATERQRQIDAEGWTPEHDDEHADSEMTLAALCYVYASVYRLDTGFVRRYWRWDWSWWKPAEKRRNLVKAGALIAAEIDRLDRASSAVTRPELGSDHG